MRTQLPEFASRQPTFKLLILEGDELTINTRPEKEDLVSNHPRRCSLPKTYPISWHRVVGEHRSRLMVN